MPWWVFGPGGLAKRYCMQVAACNVVELPLARRPTEGKGASVVVAASIIGHSSSPVINRETGPPAGRQPRVL